MLWFDPGFGLGSGFEIRPGARKLLKAHEAQTDKLREAIFFLSAAIEKSDERDDQAGKRGSKD
jgi:hypothetical protein